jgi:eukaryotic-like serine/threonine-protein kinase
MNNTRREQVEELFEVALEREPATREAYLEAACAGDPELLAEVQAMLAAHELGEMLFAERPRGAPATPAEWIGPYRVIRELGRGGMGVVFLAERADGQFRQRVAIKRIGSVDADDPVYQRFLAERQILAGLDHPSIARLLDGGVTADGRPYLVLEYVDGMPITAYCDRHRLGVEERLRLFLEVCAAVQHAHQNLVIHRDLKPGNILVTPAGQVRLLDFGIAKLLNPTLSGVSAPATRPNPRAMTPEYASPEQVRGDSITTASDVYSLGVLLYELLTGSSPYRLADRSPAEVVADVCERDPDPPSVRAMRAGGVPAATLEGEETRPLRRGPDRVSPEQRLRRRLRGDLDGITLMAMRKEPGRRYGSAELLGQDVRRHLEGQPVLAHQGGRRYRAAKLLRRHRVEVVAGALVLLSLVGGMATASWQALEAGRERDQARVERLKTAEVARFLENLFAAVDPYAPSNERLDTLRVRALLVRGAERVRTELADQPLVQAQMLDVVGRVYGNLGLYAEARPLLERALAIRRASLGPAHREVAESMSGLAALLTRLGEYEAAQPLLEEALRLDSLLLGREHPAVAADLSQLAIVLRERGDYEGAERRHLQALRALRRRGAEDDPRLAAMTTELVATLERAGDHAAAERHAREAVDLHRRLSGETHPALASALSALGLLLQRRGEYAEAETLFREAYGIAVRALGEEHPETAELVQRLASIRWWQRDHAAADSLHRESLRLKRRLYGDRHLEIAIGLNNLASVLRDTRRYDEAEAAHREALEIVRAQLGEEHLRSWAMLANHAMTLTARGDCEPAVRMMEASIAGLRRTAPRDRSRLARQQRWLGACLTRLGRFDEAEAVLLESYSALLALREEDRFVREAAGHLADLYTAWGKPARAEEYGIASGPSSRR